MENAGHKEALWQENIILADADFVDGVAFNLIVNFERMIGRRISKADLATWLSCVALDGGLRPVASGVKTGGTSGEDGNLSKEKSSVASRDTAEESDNAAIEAPETKETVNQTAVILVASEGKRELENFCPSSLDDEIRGKAFKDSVSEFSLLLARSSRETKSDSVFTDILSHILEQRQVKRIMLVPKEGEVVQEIRRILRQKDLDKRITLFAMEPLPVTECRQEILGYSLMHALGIKADEIKG